MYIVYRIRYRLRMTTRRAPLCTVLSTPNKNYLLISLIQLFGALGKLLSNSTAIHNNRLPITDNQLIDNKLTYNSTSSFLIQIVAYCLCVHCRSPHLTNELNLQIKNPSTNICLDAQGKIETDESPVGVYECHGQGGNQVSISTSKLPSQNSPSNSMSPPPPRWQWQSDLCFSHPICVFIYAIYLYLYGLSAWLLIKFFTLVSASFFGSFQCAVPCSELCLPI